MWSRKTDRKPFRADYLWLFDELQLLVLRKKIPILVKNRLEYPDMSRTLMDRARHQNYSV